MFVACGIWCLVDVSSVSPSSEHTAVCSDEGLTLETSAKHHIPQATSIPYQPCLQTNCRYSFCRTTKLEAGGFISANSLMVTLYTYYNIIFIAMHAHHNALSIILTAMCTR